MTPQAGTRLSVFGQDWWVAEQLGRGGEGTVHEVVDATGTPRFALKWYFSPEPWRMELLRYIAERGAPTDRFLWPLAIIEAADDTFGYVMHLRPAGYVSLGDLLRGRVERREDRVLRFGHELAESFLALHGGGLCYRDINFGNAFYEPVSGRALICDNDNVGIDGVSRSGVRGALDFMAPEIMRQERMPSRATDQHSLAVMLYFLLMVGHPLEGRRTWSTVMDLQAKYRYFGTEPIFAFDPDDDRNRPDPVDHRHVVDRWNRLPPSLSKLFVRAFTVGLHDPDARVQDSQWCRALTSAAERLWRCPVCGNDGFADDARPVCGRCGAPLPGWLHVGRSRLAVSELLEVTGEHLDPGAGDRRAVGVAERHPSLPGLVGLRNATSSTWTAIDGAGVSEQVPPGRRALLRDGVRISIGSTWARVSNRVAQPQSDPPT